VSKKLQPDDGELEEPGEPAWVGVAPSAHAPEAGADVADFEADASQRAIYFSCSPKISRIVQLKAE
jgi:hypothetical protein